MTQEADALDSSLDSFFANGLISNVLHVVKSGKEATVYCCESDGPDGSQLLAAKVYKSAQWHRFRNASDYQMGSTDTLDSRARRAFDNKSHYGRGVQFGHWIDSEYQTLALLHGAGANVPRPIDRSGCALLMEYIGDREAPAPMLSRVELEPAAAPALFKSLIQNVALWLRNNRVHADLSPFNVLFWNGQLTIIDFPQAVDPRKNRNALELLRRDVANVCGYFERYGIDANPGRLANDLWWMYQRGEL